MESAAASLLKRAVDMDQKEQYTMALVLYQEGVQILLNTIKETKDPLKQKHFATRASEYLKRAEKVKELINIKKKHGTYRELIKIEDKATGYGYASVFSRFLDPTVTQICIEDPYIRMFHQCQNLVRFCELAVRQCQLLSKITLTTVPDPQDFMGQKSKLEELKESLKTRLVTFTYIFSTTLHDRQISLSNGWIIKIGRGLDYFKAADGKFSLGSNDLELRSCHETTIDIFHKSQFEEH